MGAAGPVALIALWQSHRIEGIALLAVTHAFVLYAVLRPHSQWLGRVVTRFTPRGGEVWLTVDDGPTADTGELLDLLDRHRARATFFVRGDLAAASPERVKEIIGRGHSVANHSATHPAFSFWCAGETRIEREIAGGNHVIERITGTRPRWFRAPVGMKNAFVHPALERRGMRLIGWSARGFDTLRRDAEATAQRILRDVTAGAIVLVHQGHPHSLRVIELVLEGIAARGYRCTVPEEAQL